MQCSTLKTSTRERFPAGPGQRQLDIGLAVVFVAHQVIEAENAGVGTPFLLEEQSELASR